MECAIERGVAWDEAPAVVVTRSNGSEHLYNLRAMADETPGRVDKELFRLLGANEGFARDVSYGSGTTSVRARRERRVAERAQTAADADLASGDQTPTAMMVKAAADAAAASTDIGTGRSANTSATTLTAAAAEETK